MLHNMIRRHVDLEAELSDAVYNAEEQQITAQITTEESAQSKIFAFLYSFR